MHPELANPQADSSVMQVDEAELTLSPQKATVLSISEDGGENKSVETPDEATTTEGRDDDDDDESSNDANENNNDDNNNHLFQELATTKERLAAEERLTSDLKQRLELKSVSIDCQLKEKESLIEASKCKLLSAEQKNTDLTQTLVALRMENNELMKRTAALARRDQLQKASIMTSHSEIAKLMGIVESFQKRFESLATNIAGAQTTNTNDDNDHENDDEEVSSEQGGGDDNNNEQPPPQDDETHTSTTEEMYHTLGDDFDSVDTDDNVDDEAEQAEWMTERTALHQRIQALEASQLEMKMKFIDTLSRHQKTWHAEKESLHGRIAELQQLQQQQITTTTAEPQTTATTTTTTTDHPVTKIDCNPTLESSSSAGTISVD